MRLTGRDLVAIEDLDRPAIEEILETARGLVPAAEGAASHRSLEGKLVAMAFFEPSTRTRLSFETAVHRLGGRCVTIADPAATSMRKGETLSDTIRMISSYTDALVLRHPNSGAARLAADLSDRPVINAGDGAHQHPTQTLTDLATIQEVRGTLSGLRIVVLGDLKYGRAVHSLIWALALFGNEIVLTSPSSLRLPESVRQRVRNLGGRIQEEEELPKALAEADILYVTRIQRERFPDETEYRKVAGSYRIDRATLEGAHAGLRVLHPLPRLGEIAPEVDRTPHALYFRQAFLGVPVRMALLQAILGGGA
ncbi:MAG: aspartate carbamoyltransferase [Thermoplasmata archaeon]